MFNSSDIRRGYARSEGGAVTELSYPALFGIRDKDWRGWKESNLPNGATLTPDDLQFFNSAPMFLGSLQTPRAPESRQHLDYINLHFHFHLHSY